MTRRKLLAVTAWLVTAAFVIGVALPLLVERLVTNEKIGWKGQFMAFQLKDEAGNRHLGFLSVAHAFKDMTLFEYGYEAPKGKDLTPWHKKILGLGRDQVVEKEGFSWSDKGFLWADRKGFGDNLFLIGSRQNSSKSIHPFDQTELTLPGAPWDLKGDGMDWIGKFPNYQFQYEDKNFKFDLHFVARGTEWAMYNNGERFPVGDFGTGNMDELTGHVTGTVTHKQTGQSFKVEGNSLLEDSMGYPWSWIDWGAHDWSDFHFPGGWSGSLWKAHDDWQWGYHATPHYGWIWDPERKKNLQFYSVELIETDLVTDPVNKLEYPARTLWRAVGPEATLELETTNLTFKPRESRFPIGPVDMALGMSYGNNTATARLIRRDGSVVEMKDGTGTMEHFNAAIPDYVFWGPLSLVLLVLSWGAYRISVRQEAKQSMVPPVVWTIAGLIGIALLNLVSARV